MTDMTGKVILTSAQIRAARALLNWSARRLSKESGVSQSTIHRAETAEGCPSTHGHGLAAIKGTLERFGVDFLESSGVRFRSDDGAEDDGGGEKPASHFDTERDGWRAGARLR
jgi:transcriptional regulator with XRE-family HTH domain